MGDTRKRSLAEAVGDYINLRGADAVKGEIGRGGPLRIQRHAPPPKPKGWRERREDEVVERLVELADHGLPMPHGGMAIPRWNLPEDLPDMGGYEEYLFEREQEERRKKKKK